MIPILYDEKGSVEGRPVGLKLRKSIGGKPAVCLSAVDDEGDTIAQLIIFEDCVSYACPRAFNVLRDFGYDTTFAKWDDQGRIIIECL